MVTTWVFGLHHKLRNAGIVFDVGLKESEFDHAQTTYGIAFPPDLRDFLSYGLPVSAQFPNWRTGLVNRGNKEIQIKELLEWPIKGICFDIERNDFWFPEWGQKPANLQEAFRLARQMVNEAPALVPVYSHRFLPCEPLAAGNPILSIWQTDIIYYGADLVSYFEYEFDLEPNRKKPEEKLLRRVRFWSDVIDSQ